MEGEAWRLYRELGKIFLGRRGRKQTKAAWFLKRSDPWSAAGVKSMGRRKGRISVCGCQLHLFPLLTPGRRGNAQKWSYPLLSPWAFISGRGNPCLPHFLFAESRLRTEFVTGPSGLYPPVWDWDWLPKVVLFLNWNVMYLPTSLVSQRWDLGHFLLRNTAEDPKADQVCHAVACHRELPATGWASWSYVGWDMLPKCTISFNPRTAQLFVPQNIS